MHQASAAGASVAPGVDADVSSVACVCEAVQELSWKPRASSGRELEQENREMQVYRRVTITKET